MQNEFNSKKPSNFNNYPRPLKAVQKLDRFSNNDYSPPYRRPKTESLLKLWLPSSLQTPLQPPDLLNIRVPPAVPPRARETSLNRSQV